MAAREYYAAHVASEVTTTSATTWANAATLDFTPANGRDYVLLWSLELACKTDTGTDAKYRLSLDGTPVTTSNVESRVTAEYPSFFGFFKVSGAGASRSVSVGIQAEQAGQTVAVRNVSLIALALGADDHYAEALGRTDVTAGGTLWADLVSTSWTPPTDGDYVFLSSCLVDNYAATAPAYGRFDIGWTSVEWPAAVAEVAAGQMNFVAHGGVWVDGLAGGSPATLKWQGRSLNNGNNSGWTDNRILALRLSDFHRATGAVSPSDSGDTSSSLTNVLTLTDTAGGNPQLVLGAWTAAASVNNLLGAVRISDGLGTIANSARRTFATSVGRGASSGFYALRQGYAGGSQSWLLDRSSDGANSYVVRGGATLVVLDLGSAGQTLSAGAQSYALMGRAAASRAARRLPGAARSYSTSGVNATPRKGYRVRADARGHGLTGRGANLARGLRLTVAASSYALAGPVTGMLRSVAGRRLAAGPAAFSIQRRAAAVATARRVRAGAEAFVWSRLAGALRWVRLLAAGPGPYGLVGRPIEWDWVHILTPTPTGFAVAAPDAALRYSGVQFWQPAPGTSEAWSPRPGASETWIPADETTEAWT